MRIISYLKDLSLKMKLQLHIVVFILCFFSLVLHAQVDIGMDYSNDTATINDTYFTDLNNQFILRFYGLYKTNNVNLVNANETLKYRPNGIYSIGIGFNYKFLGLGISYGAPLSETSKSKKGNTQRLDIQGSMISTSIGLDGFLQIYKGYYLSNPGDFTEWENENYPQLPDMDVVTLGVNAFYIFNKSKFSYRAAFIGNQVQNRSAGSITAGLFGTFDQVKTDNGFVPADIIDSIQTDFDLKSFEAFTVGLSAGYLYTFVFGKGFYLSLAAIPGIGYRHFKVVALDNSQSNKDQFAVQLLGRIALGYTIKRFYINFNTLFNLRNYNYKSYELELSSEQIRLTLGLRFQTKASKKRNQYHPN
ncbi:MAG: hypothetical protein C0591_08800 [Marinilabiliales bacterium]|nr:MAG: hypothetical protein C0591_08800 [Marinilabiliales bacterium]